MRNLFLALAIVSLSTFAACNSNPGSNNVVGGAPPAALDTGKGGVESPVDAAAEVKAAAAEHAAAQEAVDEAAARTRELEESLARAQAAQEERRKVGQAAQALIDKLMAKRRAALAQTNSTSTNSSSTAPSTDVVVVEDAPIQPNTPDLPADERPNTPDPLSETERQDLADAQQKLEEVAADPIDDEVANAAAALARQMAVESAARDAEAKQAQAVREKAERERIQRELKIEQQTIAADKANCSFGNFVAIGKLSDQQIIELCDSLGVDVRQQIADRDQKAADKDITTSVVTDPADTNINQDPNPNDNANQNDGQAAHDHFDHAKLIGRHLPFVVCEAEFIKESKFFLFLGHTHGEMLITCRKGIGNEEFTTIAQIVGGEIGIGFKNQIEEGIMKIYGLGIGPHNFLGASAQVKAALVETEDYHTEGDGKLVSIGIGASAFQYIGFVHATGTVQGHGGAITLEIAVWAPKCNSEGGLAAKHGNNWDQQAAAARAKGLNGVDGCQNGAHPNDKPVANRSDREEIFPGDHNDR